MRSVSSPKAMIVGYDAVSALGTDLEEQWTAALSGISGIGRLTRFRPGAEFPVTIAGQVPDIDTSPYPFLSPRKLALWPSPIFKYAMLTVHRALENSGIQMTADLAPRTAITFSSAVGGQDALIQADRRLTAENKLPPPYTNPNSCINMVGGKISILTGGTGPMTATISACATGLTSMAVGAMLLADGSADVAICGAVDFPLVEPILAGFATMNGAICLRPGETARGASRSFSGHRRGFVVSEGAGCIVLTTPEFASTHGVAADVGIAGWSLNSDAHHFVAPKLETIARCMADSIGHAGRSVGDIDVVNAHAASTRIGDQVEFEALRNVFGDHLPPVTANKSLIGHAMGASSAIESILAIMGMCRDIVPPTINYRPDPEMELDCIAEGARSIQQEFVLKNAFGFGGANACMVFQRLN